jgi:hypothetical protein
MGRVSISISLYTSVIAPMFTASACGFGHWLGKYVCVYVSMYLCIYVSMHAFMYVYISTSMYMYTSSYHLRLQHPCWRFWPLSW